MLSTLNHSIVRLPSINRTLFLYPSLLLLHTPQSELYTICVLRFIMQISCRFVVIIIVVVVVFFRPPYLLLLHGLRLEKIFLFNLFMNEAAVGLPSIMQNWVGWQ